MKRVLTAVALIPVVLAIVFWAPLWLFALVVAVFIVLALYEYLGIVEAAGIKPFHAVTYTVAILPILLFLLYRIIEWQEANGRRYFSFPEYPLLHSFIMLLFLAPVIFGIPLVFRRELRGGLASAAASIWGVLYVAASLSLFIEFRADSFQNILILFVLFSVWAGDIAAYYIGKNFGRHKLAPVVSPNKSWEGAIASVIAGTGIAFAVFHFTPQLSSYFAGNMHHPMYSDSTLPEFLQVRHVPKFWHILMIGIFTNIAAQCGDLFESALKRGANVKDSGTLLPGHGGLLDRIDALLFAVPVVWYYAQLTNFLRPQ